MRVISTCERDFVRKCIVKNSRLDGRSLSEGRSFETIFGHEWGCCLVALGNTRVLAQVSAEVTEPKTVSPTEGVLHINLEISAMASPDIQYQSRNSDENVRLQRILERCIRDSKCIDLESLCIVAGSKVWMIRVDIHALNDDGNLVECANLAAISALAHFKRPEVTVMGTEVTIHSLEDKEPVPLNLHHMPICINLGLFDDSIVTDPSDIEERVADGCYIICLNAHQEICLIHRIGVLLLSSKTIQRCEDVATKRSQSLTQAVRKALEDDAYKRNTNATIGFVNMIQTATILGEKQNIQKTSLNEVIKQTQNGDSSLEVITVEANSDSSTSVQSRRTHRPEVSEAGLRAQTFLREVEAAIFEGGSSKWKNIEEDAPTSSDEEEIVSVEPLKEEKDVSSEDEAVCMSVNQLDVKPASNTRTWYSKDPFS